MYSTRTGKSGRQAKLAKLAIQYVSACEDRFDDAAITVPIGA
jgi:hypothetical protein